MLKHNTAPAYSRVVLPLPTPQHLILAATAELRAIGIEGTAIDEALRRAATRCRLEHEAARKEACNAAH